MTGYIYKIVSPSGRIYIGQTINLSKRKKAYEISNCHKQKILYSSLVKYGWEKHTFDVLEQINYCGFDNWILNLCEIYWIKEFKCNKSRYPENNGLNLTDGGSGVRGGFVGAGTRLKMSIAASKSNNGYKKGHIHSAETLEKIKSKTTGRVQSSEEIEKRASKLRGKKRPLEAVEATRLKLTGRKQTTEQIEKSVQTRRTMYENGELIPWNKGKKGCFSEETRLKMRESRLRYVLESKLENGKI